MTSAGCPINNGCTKRKLKFSCICGQYAAAVEQLQSSQVRCSSCQVGLTSYSNRLLEETQVRSQ